MENYTDNWKNINHITFYFGEEGPGIGSEDIKNESNLKLKRTALKQQKRKLMHTGK